MYRVATNTKTYNIPANWSLDWFGATHYYKGITWVFSIPTDDIVSVAYG